MLQPMLGFCSPATGSPAKTASILVRLFGDRYTHVVHPWAGHISYVLSPKIWSPKHPKALAPNPIDLLLK